MRTDLKKQLIVSGVWAAVFGGIIGVMLAQRDNAQDASQHLEAGFEAWEGAEDAQPISGLGDASAEALVDGAGARGAGQAKVERAGTRTPEALAEAGEAQAEKGGESAEGGEGAALGATVETKKTASERDEPAVERRPGTLSRDVLQEGVELLRPIAKQCYLDVLEDFPDVDGRVMLEFEVISEGGEGRVAMTEIGEGSTLYESSLHDCLQHHISEVVFDSPGEDAVVKVTYPFHFAQGEGAGEAGASNP